MAGSIKTHQSVGTKILGDAQNIKRMRSQDEQLNTNWGANCTPVEMDAANTKGLLNVEFLGTAYEQ